MIKKLSAFFISNILLVFAFAQLPNKSIDVQHYRFAIELNDENNNIKGEAEIKVKLLESTSQTAFDLVQKKANGKGMLVTGVTQEGKALNFSQDSQHVVIQTNAIKDSITSYTITYQGEPEDGLIIDKNKFNNRTFFSDNWPNRAHNWIPCSDHPSDKATVEFIITAPEHYQVVCNGLQTEETSLPNHLKLTHWKEDVAISTKIFALGAADFAVNYSGSVDCIPVYGWVYPEEKEQGFKDYAKAKEILPWYIKNVGPYAYEKLANIQSKTIFGGVENAGTIFYAEKSVGDKGIESLLAHEIAHQWFGDAASETDWQHLWLSEGFATYMTHLYLESKYGLDTLKAGMAEDRKEVVKLSKKRTTPIVDTTGRLKPMQLLNANSYQKAGWVLHMLRRKLGDSLFMQSVRNYYAKYAGGNASTEDLKKVFEEVSGQNLDSFFQQWLYTAGQPKVAINWKYDKAKKSIIVTINKEQQNMFEFPLTLSFKNNAKAITSSVNIKDKLTSVIIPIDFKPSEMIPDPNVDLLFEYDEKSSTL